MGGAIHSKGMEDHDPEAAAQHGLEMRQGANWLQRLFDEHNIDATFYATGYNLLDGNTQRRTFLGDPTFRWASPKNGWSSDYWLTHPWFSDDPYGTSQSHPAWYFGDQTRALRDAGHEIAPHTFAHLYVRGSNPEELAVDTDEWLRVASAAGLPQPSTFAFPWRSSNSLTADFYDVLYQRGIRAVTRVYERDMRDLYTLAAVPPYSEMALMPDFLLGAPGGETIEEADGGQPIGTEQGLRVVLEAIARRGTTSFWNHPEWLAPGSKLDSVRETWSTVVREAASQRDTGKLWIATVADIVAFQTDIRHVSARLERGFLGVGGWKLVVRNDSGKELGGITLTMPGEVKRAVSGSAPVGFVRVTGQPGAVVPDKIEVVDSQEQTTRQLVFEKLQPGTTEVEIEWASGQEPLE
jgi:hypothetical protein